jgi:hypothetical protein
MVYGIAETGIARGSPPGTTVEVLRVGFSFAEIRVISLLDLARSNRFIKLPCVALNFTFYV